MIKARLSVRQWIAASGFMIALLFSTLPVYGQNEDQSNSVKADSSTERSSTEVKSEVIDGPEPPPPPVDNTSPVTNKLPIPEADAASGALTYQIKIPVPAGRLGMQPDLALVYNSLNTELGSQAGYGWELSSPSIERRNVNGVNKLYTSSNFTSSLDGELREQGAGTFFARIDGGSAFRYEFLGSGSDQFWKVTDKQGKQYFFGETAASRLSSPNDNTKIFKWYLSRILDRNGNSVDFVYQKFSGQVYLQEVNYTNHQSSSGIFRVVPEYEDRPDVTLNASAGFLISRTKRLTKVKAFFGNQLTNETQLSYIQHPVNKQTLLRNVRHIGYDAQNQSASPGIWIFDYESTAATSLMTGVELPTGGKLSVSYIPSAQVIDQTTQALGNGKMPYSFYLVRKIEYIELGNPTRQEEFQYTGGAFYYGNPLDKRVAGFEKVMQTDGDGNTTTFYHQGNGNNATFGEVGDQYEKLGRPYKVEVRSASGALFTQSFNKWESSSAGVDVSRTQLDSTLTRQFDGDQDSRDSAVEYQYDSFGNLLQETRLGEVSGNVNGTYSDIGTDRIVNTFTYANPIDSNSYVVGLPSQQRVLDSKNNQKSETLHHYDGLALNTVDKGNPTTESRWIDAGHYAETHTTFNALGQVVMATDPNNNPTGFVFDQFNLYPATVTNALGQSTQFEYDYSSGQVTRIVDPNSRVFETDYDGLDRVIVERQPDASNPTKLSIKSSFEYTDQPNNVTVKKTVKLDETIEVESYAYADGFGRTVQERTQAEQAGQFVVYDQSYDNRGLLKSKSLPYFSAGVGRTPPTTDASLYVGSSYDTLRRIVAVTNSLGTTTNSYNDWKTVVTDALGKTKTLYKDAFDRLVRVDERNGAETYATRYDYDPMGSLIRITDALGNVSNFSYDGIGRRTAAEDLHAPGDGTFGVWQFEYDDANNLIRRIDPRGQTIKFEYDRLNRVSNEDFLGQPDIEVNYFYDLCPDGISRLCGDFTATVSRSREYNALGQVKKETTTVGGVPYITQTDYDFQGNIRLLINPDGSQVKYDYNQAGSLEAVSTREQGAAALTPVVANFDYSPTGGVAEVVYGSGTRTSNTYDPNELYRLKRKYTFAGSGTNVIHDLNYTFDAVGNVKQINNNSELNSPKVFNYRYDDLHRLTFAAKASSAQRLYLQSYSYDALGNFTSKSDQGLYQYGGSQGTNYANPHAATMIGTTAQTFDRNGNLESVGNQIFYDWDYNNRLRQTNYGGNIVVYDYTSGGDRVLYDTGLTRTTSPTKYFSINTTTGIEKHIFAGDTLIATVRGSGPTAEIFYDHTDHLSGTNVVTTPQGKIAERIEYYPFGSIVSDSGRVSERRKFGGHEYDQETALSNMGARYYDGAKGRFLSIDSLFLSVTANLDDPQALNAYSYARNNPLRLVDLDGRSFSEAFAQNLFLTGLELGVKEHLGYLANANGFNQIGGGAAIARGLVAPAITAISAGYDIGNIWSDPNINNTEKAAKTAYKVHDIALGGIVGAKTGNIGGVAFSTGLDATFEDRFSALKQSKVVDVTSNILLWALPIGEDWKESEKLNQKLQEEARQRQNQNKGPVIIDTGGRPKSTNPMPPTYNPQSSTYNPHGSSGNVPLTVVSAPQGQQPNITVRRR